MCIHPLQRSFLMAAEHYIHAALLRIPGARSLMFLSSLPGSLALFDRHSSHCKSPAVRWLSASIGNKVCGKLSSCIHEHVSNDKSYCLHVGTLATIRQINKLCTIICAAIYGVKTLTIARVQALPNFPLYDEHTWHSGSRLRL